MANARGLRLSIGLFLLVAIVINNAYKNTNVYNMIAPRNSTPYRFLHEILADKFDAYTRAMDGEIKRKNYFRDADDHMTLSEFMAVYESEINRSLRAIKNTLGGHHLLSKVDIVSVVSSSALNASGMLGSPITFYPQIMQMLDGMTQEIIDVNKTANASALLE